MSDCSTHRDEFPGVKRIIVHFTDPNEHDFEWPFVPLEREIESIEVDGEEWVPLARMGKMADANGYMCAEINRQQERIEDLEELVRDLWPRASFTMAPENRQGWKERIGALGLEVGE